MSTPLAHPRLTADDPQMTTAEELASVLDVSDRHVRRMAREGSWLAIDALEGRARRKLYPVRALPEAVRAKLLAHRCRRLLPIRDTDRTKTSASNVNVSGPGQLKGWQRSRAQAVIALIRHFEDLADAVGVERAAREMCEAAAAGELPGGLQDLVSVANARAGESRTLSPRSLKRWRKTMLDAGWPDVAAMPRVVVALAPKDPELLREPRAWEGELLRLWARPMKRPLAALLEDLAGLLPDGAERPSYDAARRFLARMSPAERERGRRGPNALLALKGHKRLTTDHLRPMDVISGDGHTFKADVQHPFHGRPFRPEVCAILDLATRRVVGWSIGLAESQAVVADAMRMAVETHGLFGTLRSDNGGGWSGELMTAAASGLYGRLGAIPMFATPGRAQARGKIERLQQSLWIRAAKKLPTYAGRDMDREARKHVETRVRREIRATGSSRILISWEDFVGFLEREVAAYNARPHRSLPKVRDPLTGRLRNMSPDEALARHNDEGWSPALLPSEQVDDLFRPQVTRKVARGWVRLPWGAYYDDALVRLHGQEVRVGYDIRDGGRVWVRDARDLLVCIARRDANAVPEVPDAAAHAARVRLAGRSKRLLDRLADAQSEAAGSGFHAPVDALPDDEGDDVTDLLARGLARIGRS